MARDGLPTHSQNERARYAVAQSRSSGAGFTLIEVLAALVIVALGMLGVIEAVTQAARNGTYLREKTLAHWIAMNLITERRLAGAPRCHRDQRRSRIRRAALALDLSVTQTQVETMRRMDVTVRAADAAEGTSLATRHGLLRHCDRACRRRIGSVGRLPAARLEPVALARNGDDGRRTTVDFGTEPDVTGDDHMGPATNAARRHDRPTHPAVGTCGRRRLMRSLSASLDPHMEVRSQSRLHAGRVAGGNGDLRDRRRAWHSAATRNCRSRPNTPSNDSSARARYSVPCRRWCRISRRSSPGRSVSRSASNTCPRSLAGESVEYKLEFTRAGWSNTAGLRGRRCSAWRTALDQDGLWRDHWRVLDRTQAAEPIRTNC